VQKKPGGKGWVDKEIGLENNPLKKKNKPRKRKKREYVWSAIREGKNFQGKKMTVPLSGEGGGGRKKRALSGTLEETCQQKTIAPTSPEKRHR